jgi:NAD(P)-dependent dehydrogenase (short-subunit alcohol dehydrogenase family)
MGLGLKNPFSITPKSPTPKHPKNMNVLITGGSGLVGTRLTEILLQKGFSVSHLTREVEVRRREVNKNISLGY